MKVVSVFLLYFFVNGISSYTTKKLEAIGDDLVNDVQFDEKGNSYVTTFDSKGVYQFHKLSPSNDIMQSVDFSDNLSDMFVSKRGDVFFDSFGDLKLTVSYIPAGSTKLEQLGQIKTWFTFYLNKNGSFFYCKNDGLYVLRPNSSSVLIKNLSSCDGFLQQKSVSDKIGNTYFAVKLNGKHSVALVSKEALSNEIPHATILYTADHERLHVVSLAIDEDDNLWMTTTDYENPGKTTPKESSIKKYSNGTWESILTEKNRMHNEIICTQERNYVMAQYFGTARGSIFYITPNHEVVEIPEMKSLSEKYFDFKGLVDSEGQAYFYNTQPEFSSSYGYMVTLKPNETRPISISIPRSETSRVKSVKFDFNGDLWMTVGKERWNRGEGEILHLKKGETAMNVRSNLRKGCEFTSGDIHFNFMTKKIYLSCNNGLFVSENI